MWHATRSGKNTVSHREPLNAIPAAFEDAVRQQLAARKR